MAITNKQKYANREYFLPIIKNSLDILVGNLSPVDYNKKSLPEILIGLKYATDPKDVLRAKKLIKQVINDLRLLENELKLIIKD